MIPMRIVTLKSHFSHEPWILDLEKWGCTALCGCCQHSMPLILIILSTYTQYAIDLELLFPAVVMGTINSLFWPLSLRPEKSVAAQASALMRNQAELVGPCETKTLVLLTIKFINPHASQDKEGNLGGHQHPSTKEKVAAKKS